MAPPAPCRGCGHAQHLDGLPLGEGHPCKAKGCGCAYLSPPPPAPPCAECERLRAAKRKIASTPVMRNDIDAQVRDDKAWDDLSKEQAAHRATHKERSA